MISVVSSPAAVYNRQAVRSPASTYSSQSDGHPTTSLRDSDNACDPDEEFWPLLEVFELIELPGPSAPAAHDVLVNDLYHQLPACEMVLDGDFFTHGR